jgi:hypothetical protein
MPAFHTPDDATLGALYEALDYHAESNELIWLKPSRRLAEGSPAGTLNRLGRLVVGFRGRKYPAGSLAWFLHHNGEWPPFPVKFRNGDATDLRPDNLMLAPEKYVHTPQARRMRVYRAEVRERRVERLEKSHIDNVKLLLNGQWSVRDPRNYSVQMGEFDNRRDAEDFARAVETGRQFIAAHPAPTGLPAVTAGEGKGVLTLAEAHGFFAYDPDAGAFYYRWTPIREGFPATQLNDRNRPFVRASGRQYPAGMMAWFLVHHVWPARKQIAYRDGNPKNLTLANLYLKDRP